LKLNASAREILPECADVFLFSRGAGLRICLSEFDVVEFAVRSISEVVRDAEG